MSKLKLLLLGGIFALFGIFNFSSAKDFSLCESYNGGYNYNCNYTAVSKNLIVSDFSCGSLCRLQIGLNSKNIVCEIDYGFSSNGKLTNTCNNLEIGTTYYFYAKGLPFSSILLNDGSFDMFNNGLTPAVEGVKTTVNQIIPLVVFIGIGVLVVTLGFIAIRWLVNWLGGKIKSVFKSKRG